MFTKCIPECNIYDDHLKSPLKILDSEVYINKNQNIGRTLNELEKKL